jgi:DNA-binding NarL/FixJ family response regulator
MEAGAMHRIILADDQAIFRAGTARVLAMEDDMRIIAQCEEPTRLITTIRSFQAAVVIFSTGLKQDLDAVVAELQKAGSRGILVAEKNEEIAELVTRQLGGIVGRCISQAAMVDCVRRVARGQQLPKEATQREVPAPDMVGARVRDRLTPKEMQIVALIVQGCKNREIAITLNTKEQVIKNYLRTIYDKIGVSDRLELALFTLHHRLLKEAAVKAGNLLQMKKTA